MNTVTFFVVRLDCAMFKENKTKQKKNPPSVPQSRDRIGLHFFSLFSATVTATAARPPNLAAQAHKAANWGLD